MQFNMGEFAILWKARCIFLFGKYFGKCNRPFSGWDPGYWLIGSQHQIGIAHWVKILGVKRACLSKSVLLTIGIQWFLRREVVPLKTLHFDSGRSFETMNRLSNIQGSSNSKLSEWGVITQTHENSPGFRNILYSFCLEIKTFSCVQNL